MTDYAVGLTDAALAAIAAQARYLLRESSNPEVPRRWLTEVWDAVDSLERLPHRSNLAMEDAYVEDEIRQRIVGPYLLLYTVDDERRQVWVLGIRHGRRLARPEDLREGTAPRDGGP